jgi:hypothetical protein
MNDQSSANFVELDEFLKAFAENISRALKQGHVQKGFLTTVAWNRQSIAHSRIHALIAKTGFDLGYVAEIEAGFTPAEGRQFKPDVQLWRSNDLAFLIEYESTNSSSSVVISKDLEHYRLSSRNELGKNFPEYWLIMYTFPDQAVQSWQSWDYDNRDSSFARMARNPHNFYKKGLRDPSFLSDLQPPKRCPEVAQYPGISKYTESRDWDNRKVFLINLTPNGLEIDFPERFSRKYDFAAAAR